MICFFQVMRLALEYEPPVNYHETDVSSAAEQDSAISLTFHLFQSNPFTHLMDILNQMLSSTYLGQQCLYCVQTIFQQVMSLGLFWVRAS